MQMALHYSNRRSEYQGRQGLLQLLDFWLCDAMPRTAKAKAAETTSRTRTLLHERVNGRRHSL